jgi:hypothetical protein
MRFLSDDDQRQQKFGHRKVPAGLGTCFANACVTHLRLAAALEGTLIKGLEQDKVVWGMD